MGTRVHSPFDIRLCEHFPHLRVKLKYMFTKTMAHDVRFLYISIDVMMFFVQNLS